MKRIFIVDLTTVRRTFLSNKPKLKPEDEIIIFWSGSHRKLPFSILEEASETMATVSDFRSGSKKEDIQFVISSYTGLKVGELGSKAEYYLITRDHQYSALLDFVKSNYSDIKIYRAATIYEAMCKEAD